MEELAPPMQSALTEAHVPTPRLSRTAVVEVDRERSACEAQVRHADESGETTPSGAGPPNAKTDADTLRWRQLLAGTPREVLSRIILDDPLDVRERVARALRERAHLLDADRVHLRSLARCARAAARYHGRPELAAWIEARIDEAIEDLLLEDFEAERSGIPPGSEPGAAFVALARPLGLEPESMRRACVVFNQLAFEDRRAFFDLVIYRRRLDDLVRETGRGATEIARRARRALETILNSPAATAFDAQVKEEEER